MRLLFVASLFSVVAAGATFACSSSDPVKAGADAGKDAKAPDNTTTDDDDSTADAAPDPGPVDAGPEPDAEPVEGEELTKEGDAGSQCDEDSFREKEPNEEASPNELPVIIGNTKICGMASEAEPDFVTFKMPPGTRSWFFNPGTARISGTCDGKPFEGGDFSELTNLPAEATWVVKIEREGDKPLPYRVRFRFCKSVDSCNG